MSTGELVERQSEWRLGVQNHRQEVPEDRIGGLSVCLGTGGDTTM